MKLLGQIKPISYLKAHTAEVVRNLSTQTQNVVAKAVTQ
ncbi:prevent-host-death protein [Marinomonas ushuaiensis DSM 15871]|uniref:Prevent-host-death protein n=2 Tax=Marinomonas TaxID=28253 RepID=X7E9Q4_9GAMM|nr:prevent-host-death protein [Marinomonas ushuaiensis DSM 15871]